MEWCVAIHRIEECSAAIRGRHEASDVELKTLLGFIDRGDVLVAYAAKEELQKVLTDDRIAETRCVNGVVKAIILASPAAWRREGSGFRLQLLRQLIKMNTGRQSVEGGSEDGGSCDEEDLSGSVVEYSYLQAVLKNLLQVGVMVRSAFMTADRGVDLATPTAAAYSVQYEGLAFLSDLVKRLDSLEIADSFQVGLSEQMMTLMDEVFVTMNYVSQPAFVSCAVLGLLGAFQELLKSWKGQAQGDEDDCLEAVYSKWLERCLVWLMQSSCTSTALRLLNDNECPSVSSQKAFIATSSRYPFLQQWLLYLSRMGVAFLEASLTRTKSADGGKLQKLHLTGESHVWSTCMQKQLPSRQQLFTVLAEQDDVMIEVLNGLTRMATLADNPDGKSCPLAQWCPAFSACVTAEYDPDLLFADLVETLGRDHLVMLDLLVSNETQMLEYFMRYMRRLSAHWGTSKQKLHTYERLEGVMSVLIRLRLEIGRLVAANLFPYGAGPLTRRLLAIEQLYEKTDDDAEQL